ncbi:MAG: hypothetical protein KKE86_09605 [Planctomycetes bacterium]|nr:hypothetical protein [Planctomycetota bacterium]
MREIRQSGSEGGEAELNRPSLPLSNILILERGVGPGLIACANLTAEALPLPMLELSNRALLLSTEAIRYGGRRDADRPLDGLLPYEMLLFGPKGQLP